MLLLLLLLILTPTTASQNSDATNHANLLTISSYGTPVAVQALTGMTYPRAYANSVVLPDGKVLTMGGQVRG